MLLLRSYEAHTQLFQYDPLHRSLTAYTMRDSGAIHIDGVSAQIDGEVWLFYRYQGNLHLVTPNYSGIIDSDTHVKLIKDSVSIIEIYQGHTIIVRKLYHNPNLVPSLEEDLTPFLEEEDFDFGAWLQNVINSSERRKSVYANPDDLWIPESLLQHYLYSIAANRHTESGAGVADSTLPDAATIHDAAGEGSQLGTSGGFLGKAGVDWVNPNTGNDGVSPNVWFGIGAEWHIERTLTVLTGSVPRLGPDPCPSGVGYCGDTGVVRPRP